MWNPIDRYIGKNLSTIWFLTGHSKYNIEAADYSETLVTAHESANCQNSEHILKLSKSRMHHKTTGSLKETYIRQGTKMDSSVSIDPGIWNGRPNLNSIKFLDSHLPDCCRETCQFVTSDRIASSRTQNKTPNNKWFSRLFTDHLFVLDIRTLRLSGYNYQLRIVTWNGYGMNRSRYN
jgi:hypothetical protein